MLTITKIIIFLKKILITIIFTPFALLLTILLETESIFLLFYYIWVKPDQFSEAWEKTKEQISGRINKNRK